ncbi:MAG: tetratricopeptide repeat protein [Candidatus Eisenbacteria bacterium]
MLRFFERRETPVKAVLVTLLAILAYANTLSNGFVWTDRTAIVEGKAILRSGVELVGAFVKPAWTFKGAPSAEGGGYYRPVTAISCTIDRALYGENPAGYHATNVFLHGAVTLLLFLFLQRLFARSAVPFLASLLFAVHPIHTEAVAWISGRSGLLSGLFAIAALYLYTRADEHRGFFAGSLAATAIALGAKEEAIVLPLLVFLTRACLRPEGGALFAWKREGPYFVLALAYVALRSSALGTIGTGVPHAGGPALLIPTVVRVVAGYVRLLFLPYPLHTNDAVRLSTFVLEPRVFLSLLFLAAVLYGFLRHGKERREVRFGLLWLGITLLPLLNLLPLLHFRAERFLYLPSAGFLIAAAALFDRWGARIVGRGRKLGLEPGELVTAALVLVLAFGTVARNRTWKDDYTLFSDTLAKNRYAPEATFRLGQDAYRGGAYQEAANLMRASLALDPGWAAFLPVAEVHADLGLALYKLKDLKGAEQAFREALRLRPEMEEGRFGQALIASAEAQHDEALRLYKEILTINPAHEDARYNLAVEYEALDSLGRAEQVYAGLLARNPYRKDAHLNLGTLLARQGRFDEALRAYRNALRLAPQDPKLHFNIGLLFAAAGEREGAEQALRTVLELDPDYGEARDLLEALAPPDTAAPPDTEP